MNNADINYLSSESVCRLFSIEQNKGQTFINGYEIRKDYLLKEIQKLISPKVISSFNKKSFLATDESVLKVKKAQVTSSVDVLYKVNVLSLLSPKEVISSALSKDLFMKSVSKSKVVEIIINCQNKELKINVDIEHGDLYRDIIERISNEINNSGFSLFSKIVYGNKKTELRLQIKGDNGENNNFEISVKGDEILKNLFNFEVISEASDYKYQIADTVYKSLSKDVEIAKNVKVTILDVGYCDIISTFDIDEVIKDISLVVDKYNDLIDYLIMNKNYTIVNKEIKRYQDVLSGILYELSVLGIDLTLTSRINIDKRRMKKKLIDDSNYARKYIVKSGGLFDKIQLLLETSQITLNQIARNDDKKAMVMNLYGKVNGKTISHEPYVFINQSEKTDI